MPSIFSASCDPDFAKANKSLILAVRARTGRAKSSWMERGVLWIDPLPPELAGRKIGRVILIRQKATRAATVRPVASQRRT